MKVHTVIFDLDGTLIDSAPSILSSMRAAFDQVGIEPIKPLTYELIGPPLNELFINLLNEEYKEKLPKLLEEFKRNYDESGYKGTIIYESVTEMLDVLRQMNLKLYIATNKRILPTLKILNHLKWEDRFEGVYALDYFYPIMKNKTELLLHLYKNLPNITNGAVYVGDRPEDAEAAKGAGFPFLWAVWGYGQNNEIYNDFRKINNPHLLPKVLQNYLELEI
jgi:phosphoglycolate phosphatase